MYNENETHVGIRTDNGDDGKIIRVPNWKMQMIGLKLQPLLNCIRIICANIENERIAFHPMIQWPRYGNDFTGTAATGVWKIAGIMKSK